MKSLLPATYHLCKNCHNQSNFTRIYSRICSHQLVQSNVHQYVNFFFPQSHIKLIIIQHDWPLGVKKKKGTADIKRLIIHCFEVCSITKSSSVSGGNLMQKAQTHLVNFFSYLDTQWRITSWQDQAYWVSWSKSDMMIPTALMKRTPGTQKYSPIWMRIKVTVKIKQGLSL